MWFARHDRDAAAAPPRADHPQYILFHKLGWVDTFLPLIVPQFLATEAFFVFLMVQFMRGDPAGAGRGGPHRRLPALRHLPARHPAAERRRWPRRIFSFIWTWNDFFRQLVYLSDSRTTPSRSRCALFIDSTSADLVGPMFAMSVLSLLPVFLFFIAFQRLLTQGIATQGFK